MRNKILASTFLLVVHLVLSGISCGGSSGGNPQPLPPDSIDAPTLADSGSSNAGHD
jgi:hypothetical protein